MQASSYNGLRIKEVWRQANLGEGVSRSQMHPVCPNPIGMERPTGAEGHGGQLFVIPWLIMFHFNQPLLNPLPAGRMCFLTFQD